MVADEYGRAGRPLGRNPPQPLVSTTVPAPAAAAVRTPWTTLATPRPSYRCVRPRKISACRPPEVRIGADGPGVPLDGGRREAGQLGGRQLGDGLAEQVDRRHPSRTEDEGDVVVVVSSRSRCAARSASAYGSEVVGVSTA